MSTSTPVQSVRKALDILTLLIFDDPERQGIALGELAGKLSLPAATAHNLVKTLCHSGYARPLGGGRYASGSKCDEIGRYQFVTSRRVVSQLAAHLEQIGRKLGETVIFAVLAHGKRIRLASFDARHLVRIDTTQIDAGNPFTVPTGRLLAAFATPAEREMMLQQYGTPAAEVWPEAAADGLEAALEAIRQRGYEKIANQELTAYAVPVVADAGPLQGALGYFAPTFRVAPGAAATLPATLRRAAIEMATIFELGGLTRCQPPDEKREGSKG